MGLYEKMSHLCIIVFLTGVFVMPPLFLVFFYDIVK